MRFVVDGYQQVWDDFVQKIPCGFEQKTSDGDVRQSQGKSKPGKTFGGNLGSRSFVSAISEDVPTVPTHPRSKTLTEILSGNNWPNHTTGGNPHTIMSFFSQCVPLMTLLYLGTICSEERTKILKCSLILDRTLHPIVFNTPEHKCPLTEDGVKGWEIVDWWFVLLSVRFCRPLWLQTRTTLLSLFSLQLSDS